ncbi:sulfotransferase domain-containing protein [Lutimonas zeaxanthinifaciens]|uniref:sulfotransferase domain-containing protein n=1 Tax=Lutimonas zeaxanthinifaciens TaxID=3060215 RepID=UPI00265D5091|nr:sulfotransferase domain-containing protein [Lutimonas sp. YSD2104]WKK67354.1 sulfotransferase domain-containing protein [Lutimonas sp. YSD2104]
MKKHVLIVGSNRSGTTWVGEMIRLSGKYNYIYEPFRGRDNLKVENPIRHHFEYVTKENHPLFKNYLDVCLSKQPLSLTKQLKIGSSFFEKNVFLLKWLFVSVKREFYFNDRFIIKDPLALFSVNWINENYDTATIVISRHPAAYVASIKRLGWRHNIGNILKQEEFVKKYLLHLRDELKSFNQTPDNLLQEATLRWKVYQSFINTLKRESNNYYFIRHEDLSSNVYNEYSKIYNYLGINMKQSVEEKIKELNSRDSEPLGQQVHVLKRDSFSNIKRWKEILTKSEIEYIRNQTINISKYEYNENDW